LWAEKPVPAKLVIGISLHKVTIPMKKTATYTASTVLALTLLATHSWFNLADAGQKRKAAGGGGCQTLSPSTLEAKASPYQTPISSASKKYGVRPELVKAVITIESCFKPTARGSSGEKGLMQLMPGTAKRLNIRNGYNAWQNIHGGAKYLGLLLGHYEGDTHRAVAAFNAGEGNVKKAGKIPNRTYVAKVMHAYGKFARVKAASTPNKTSNLKQVLAEGVLPWADLPAKH
jgi:hypothetical protein